MDVRRAVRPRALLAALLLTTLLSGCGGAGQQESSPGESQEQAPSASPTAEGAAADDPAAAEAVLEVIDTAVAVRPAAAETFDEAADGLGLVAGDTVQTDPAGFAEIQYGDGSLTRVDVDSTVTVVALEGAIDAPDVEVQLDVGRVWNRVADGGADRRFEVGTDVGTAAVRGTAFEVDCRTVLGGACLFAVYEGTVAVTPLSGDAVVLGPFEYVVVAADGTIQEQGAVAADLTSPEAVDPDWVRDNATRDEDGGAGPIARLEDAPTSALALGAIYDCGTLDDATSYYRWFADGQVIDVTSTGTAEQVSGWFVATSEKAGSSNPDAEYGVGTYTLDDGRLEGSTTEGDVTVTFTGTVADDGTVAMTTESSFNGFVADVTCTPTSA